MTRKRLGSVVWTARHRDGTPYLMVRWLANGCMQVGGARDNGVCHWAYVEPRDVRRLVRLMQQALDWRYGKRRPLPVDGLCSKLDSVKRSAQAINIGAWIDQDT